MNSNYLVNEIKYDDFDLRRVRGAGYRKGLQQGIWTGVIWMCIAFVVVMTAAVFYTPQGFC